MPQSLLLPIAEGAVYYLLGACLVIGGVAAGLKFVAPCGEHSKSRGAGVLESMANWDGQWYAQIATRGYSFDPGRESSVAFFPAFPLVARGIAAVTRMRAETALLVTAHAFFFGWLALMAAYLRRRLPGGEHDAIGDVLLVATVFPTTFYCRMAYSESMLLFLAVLAFEMMERQSRPVYVALVVGAATATRPVAVALLPPLAMYLWQRSTTRAGLMCKVLVLLPVACWGLLAYIAYQAWAFGAPLAFIQTQVHWNRTVQDHSWLERAVGLLTLEPIRAVYDSASSCYWAHWPPREAPLLNMMFANPIYFLFTAASLGIGTWKRWLNGKEIALGALLLLIPYVLQGDRLCMASQARFASVVFPAYVVWGRILHRLKWPIAAVVLTVSGALLGAYAAMFARWYWFY